jgi:O-antigen/teichoic acid export membrane protein
VDLGLFGVVGSIILLITFLNSALTTGVGRFYAHSIGKNSAMPSGAGRDELHRWFNTAFSTHLGIAIIVLTLGWPLGEYAIRNCLNIPDNRLNACVVVYRISIANALFEIISVPFMAMYSAHQALAKVAMFRTFQSFLILTLAWILLGVETDRLIFYAGGLAASSMSITLILVFRSLFLYPMCRPDPRLFFQRNYFFDLFSYVGWKFFGTGCVVARNGGLPVMINLMFGPVMNAAFAIANRVSIQASTLATSMQSAFQPAIVSAEGKGDRPQMLEMSLRVCRLGSLLVLIFAIPLALEMEAVLILWLKEPPPFTSGLCQWIIAVLGIDKMTSGAMIAVNAHGKIALYELFQGSTFLVALPIMWILYRAGLGVNSVGAALFVSNLFYCLGRLLFAKGLVRFSLLAWLQRVFIPVSVIVVFSASIGYGVQKLMNESILRLLMVLCATSLVTATSGCVLLTQEKEKYALLSTLIKIKSRIFAALKPI